MDTSSSEIGEGSVSEAALNLTVPVEAEYEIAVRSRLRCVRRTDKSVVLSASVPRAGANVDVNSSRENMREVLDVATLDARSSTAFAAACQ